MIVALPPASTVVNTAPGERIVMSMELDTRYCIASGSVRVTEKSMSRFIWLKVPRTMAIRNGHCETTRAGVPIRMVVRCGVGVAATGSAARPSASKPTIARTANRVRMEHHLSLAARAVLGDGHGLLAGRSCRPPPARRREGPRAVPHFPSSVSAL
jgi:hypothetical protein